ncbi:hypothetical protein ABZ897_26490 [Nonomuraea sp. NPDC046802]|uniref:hypothetical protein n=1 Tax=Nonomuraea sp. NPDC046802 TaxID=3154919 RepID=UPI0033D45464
MAIKRAVITIAAISAVTVVTAAPAFADDPAGQTSVTDEEFKQLAPGESLSQDALDRELALLNQPAPAPQPIAVSDLPLNAEDKQALESGKSVAGYAPEKVKADGSVSIAAADVWCGNWLADPGSGVSWASGPSAIAGTTYTSSYTTVPEYEIYWRSNHGQAAANSVWYGWSKMYPTSDAFWTDGPAKRITTGWWDTSGSAHFCGWGSSQYRSFGFWADGSYSAGIRRTEADYIRPHGWVDSDLGWEYGSRVMW